MLAILLFAPLVRSATFTFGFAISNAGCCKRPDMLPRLPKAAAELWRLVGSSLVIPRPPNPTSAELRRPLPLLSSLLGTAPPSTGDRPSTGDTEPRPSTGDIEPRRSGGDLLPDPRLPLLWTRRSPLLRGLFRSPAHFNTSATTSLASPAINQSESTSGET